MYVRTCSRHVNKCGSRQALQDIKITRREGGGSGEETEVLAVQEEIQELDTNHSDSAIMLLLA